MRDKTQYYCISAIVENVPYEGTFILIFYTDKYHNFKFKFATFFTKYITLFPYIALFIVTVPNFSNFCLPQW